jgi:hypothetical protein
VLIGFHRVDRRRHFPRSRFDNAESPPEHRRVDGNDNQSLQVNSTENPAVGTRLIRVSSVGIVDKSYMCRFQVFVSIP